MTKSNHTVSEAGGTDGDGSNSVVSSLDVPSRTATSNSEAGETVACTLINKPFTDITVESKSQVAGDTNSTITRTPSDDLVTVLGEDEDENALVALTDLLPDAYQCTIVVEDGS